MGFICLFYKRKHGILIDIHAVAAPRGEGGLGGHAPPVLIRSNFVFRLNSMSKCFGRGNILATYFL